MANLNDKDLLSDILKNTEFINNLEKEVLDCIKREDLPIDLSYPLDKQTINELSNLKKITDNEGDGNLPYSKVEILNEFWKSIIKKSIQCLRLFDTREPFKETPEKTIVAYGIDDLIKYYKSYTEFEGLLYGSNVNYRDHIFHVFRTWLIGLNVIIEHKFNIVSLDGLEDNWDCYGKLTTCEKISMWTIIAFCHDLGYPLEKSKDILRVTQNMMQEIVRDSKITADFSFDGIQIWSIRYIVDFISTKMKPLKEENGKKYYNGRKQPKYCFKLTESLKDLKHGLISAIILYTTLLYFKESDFNLNEDYKYKDEDARQFYIRREILRAIASHTCPDIYNVKVTTFSSLLYICDEMQNWGRKDWHELYSAQEFNKSGVTINEFNDKKITYTEDIMLGEKAEIKKFVYDLFNKQYGKYKEKFRDGQESKLRDFDIKNKIIVEKNVSSTKKPKVLILISILGNKQSDKFEVKYTNCGDDTLQCEDVKDRLFGLEFRVK
jgi:hypothetical protein